jgi:hypothetical protein
MRYASRMGLIAGLAGLAMSSAATPIHSIVGDSWDAPETRYRRGKRPQAKPRKRPNMLHVSKRVRRKHRRSA